MAELTPQRFRALTKEKINNIAKSNPAKLVGLIDEMKSLVIEQANKIYKNGNNPLAFESLVAKSPQIFQAPTSNNSTAQREIALQLLETYKSKTMTVKGAEAAAHSENIKIFGGEWKKRLVTKKITDKEGNVIGERQVIQEYQVANYKMSPLERYNFWAMYQQIKDETTTKNSDVILQAMQNVMKERGKGDGAPTIDTIIGNFIDNYGEFDRDFINDSIAEIERITGFSYS